MYRKRFIPEEYPSKIQNLSISTGTQGGDTRGLSYSMTFRQAVCGS